MNGALTRKSEVVANRDDFAGFANALSGAGGPVVVGERSRANSKLNKQMSIVSNQHGRKAVSRRGTNALLPPVVPSKRPSTLAITKPPMSPSQFT